MPKQRGNVFFLAPKDSRVKTRGDGGQVQLLENLKQLVHGKMWQPFGRERDNEKHEKGLQIHFLQETTTDATFCKK